MSSTWPQVKAWRKKNPDKWRESRIRYEKKHKDTIRNRRRRYNEKHREEIKEQRLKAKYQIRIFIEEYKVSHGCVVCGENFPAALDFHHTGEKEANVSQIWMNSWGISRVQKEINKCVLLCANCHRKLHAGFLSLD